MFSTPSFRQHQYNDPRKETARIKKLKLKWPTAYMTCTSMKSNVIQFKWVYSPPREWMCHPYEVGIKKFSWSKSRSHVCKWPFQWFFGVYSLVETHAMSVVERLNTCGVPVYSGISNTSMIEVVWHKLTESIKAATCRALVYKRQFQRFFGSYFLGRDTCDGSCWQTEYVWGASVKWNPTHLNDSSSLTQVDRTKEVTWWVLVYKRQFQRLFDVYSFTETHAMVVVGRQNMCGVRVYRGIHNTWMIQAS